MNYRILQPRSQGFLFNSIEERVSEENPVRLIDLLIEKLYESGRDRFQSSKRTGNDKSGRKAYPPVLFCKLYLYGYLNRINSSRRLEQECHRNIEVMWLMHKEHPDFKTISDFRKDNGDLIRRCSQSFRRFLKDSGYITARTVAYDGTKLKACTSKSGYTLDGLVKRLAGLDRQLDKYPEQLDRSGEKEEQQEYPCHESDLMERIASLEEEVQKLQKYRDIMETKGQTCYFPNDPDSNLMKGRYGSYPGYNIQGGMDAENHMVVSAGVSTDVNDRHRLEPDVEVTCEDLGVYPETVPADKGYANMEAIERVESNEKTQCVIPLQEKKTVYITFVLSMTGKKT